MMATSWPVSSATPTADEQSLRDSLKSYMVDNNLLDDAAHAGERQKAINHVESLCRRWAADHSEQEQGRIVIHGSRPLGTQLRTSNTDAIFIAPNTTTNEQFFTELPRFLRDDSDISNVLVLTTAQWPIIKLRVYNKFDLDLQPIVCIISDVPEDIGERRVLQASQMLSLFSADNYDAMRSMRIMQFVQDAIKETGVDVDEFRLAMQALKYWAKQNKMYGFDRLHLGMGFVGLSWCIMLVFICQHYPRANCAVTLLHKLFQVFGSEWRWPRPVCLHLVEEFRPQHGLYAPNVHGEYSNMPLGKGLMPIMTPLPETSNRIDFIRYQSQKVRIVSVMKRAAGELQNNVGVENIWEQFFKEN